VRDRGLSHRLTRAHNGGVDLSALITAIVMWLVVAVFGRLAWTANKQGREQRSVRFGVSAFMIAIFAALVLYQGITGHLPPSGPPSQGGG
jgi:hypothetical protein